MNYIIHLLIYTLRNNIHREVSTERTVLAREKGYTTKTSIMHYCASSTLVVNSVQVSGLLEEEAVLDWPLFITKAGCLGVGTVPVSLSSIVTTFDIVGRSFGSSSMHKSPTFTHFINLAALRVSCIVWSIKSNTLFSVHNLHA